MNRKEEEKSHIENLQRPFPIERSPVIFNIQALRAYAAMAVVLAHSSFNYWSGVHLVLDAVPIFFVISGFLMAFIPRTNAADFAFNRCIRIIPLYFVLTLVYFFMQAPPGLFDDLSTHSGTSKGWTLEMLVRSVFFIPYQNSNGCIGISNHLFPDPLGQRGPEKR